MIVAIRFVFVCAVAAGVAHAGAYKTKCPWVMGKHPFDENKMAGDWYILAGTPLLGPRLSKCPKFSLTPTQSNGELYLNFKLSGIHPKDGTAFGYESVSQAYKADKAAMSQGVWRRVGTTQWSGIYKQVVVQTDYENYAVFLACRPLFNDTTNMFDRAFAAQVWGRTTTLSKEKLDVLLNLLTSYDIDPADVQVADHSCA